MSIDHHHHPRRVLAPLDGGDSSLAHVDPRLRIVTAVAISIVVAAVGRVEGLAIALVGAVAAVVFARLAPRHVWQRIWPVELLLAVLLLVLPWAVPHRPLGISPWHGLSSEGLRLGLVIAMKANAIVLWLLALLGRMDATTLGHALGHLHVPQKLAHLLLFTIRYLEVLDREYRRLRAAMKVRGFRPGMNLHTYRSLGYLVGMLLVRSFDRSERIAGAMKCRGFRGHFYLLDHFAFSWRRDLTFCGAAAALLAILLIVGFA